MIRVSRDIQGVDGTSLIEVEAAGPCVAVVGLMHGNEPVGGLALQRLEDLAERYLTSGSILCVRANLEAAAQQVRHTAGGRDMNRLWDGDTLVALAAKPAASLCYEERRVQLLARLLIPCDAIVDLHSTSRPAPPFLLFRDDQRHRRLAMRLGVSKIVTGLYEGAILGGGMCQDVGLLLGERSSRIGLTFEAGEHTEEHFDVAH